MTKKKATYDDLNALFERFISSKNQKLRQVENLKKKVIERLDKEIDALYKKKNFVAKIFSRRLELKKYKLSVGRKFFRNSFFMNVRYILAMPFIYMMFFPALMLQIFLEIYHRVCFPLYGIPLVNPKEYFVMDRGLLPYLNWLEKLNCMYCSYVNCLFAYATEIAGRTEKFWCPIKHARKVKGSHPHYGDFVNYDDGEALRKRWKKMREFDDKK